MCLSYNKKVLLFNTMFRIGFNKKIDKKARVYFHIHFLHEMRFVWKCDSCCLTSINNSEKLKHHIYIRKVKVTTWIYLNVVSKLNTWFSLCLQCWHIILLNCDKLSLKMMFVVLKRNRPKTISFKNRIHEVLCPQMNIEPKSVQSSKSLTFTK